MPLPPLPPSLRLTIIINPTDADPEMGPAEEQVRVEVADAATGHPRATIMVPRDTFDLGHIAQLVALIARPRLVPDSQPPSGSDTAG